MATLDHYPLVNATENRYQCLLSPSRNDCFYNPANPPIYFSFGAFLTAIGLWMTAMQLIDPIKKITLKIKAKKVNFLMIFFGLSCLSVICSAIIPQLQYLQLFKNLYILRYALSWEVVSFILIIISFLGFLARMNRHKNIINDKNSEKALLLIQDSIDSGREGYLEASVDLLKLNLRSIFNLIRKYDGKNHNVSDHFCYILSKKKVSNNVVCNRADFLSDLINLINSIELKFDLELKEFDSGKDPQIILSIRKLLLELVENLYFNTNSYFYEKSTNIPLYSDIYKKLFNSKNILYFKPLSCWNYYLIDNKKLSNKRYIEVYLKSIKKVIKFHGFNTDFICNDISNSFEKLIDYVGEISKDSVIWNDRVEWFLGFDFPKLYKKALTEGNINDSQLIYSKKALDDFNTIGFHNKKKDKKDYANITFFYAKALVDYLGVISEINRDEKWFRTDAVYNSMNGILLQGSSDDSFINVRKYFFDYLWEKIENSVEYGLYPCTIKSYWEIMRVRNNADWPEWKKIEDKKFRSYIIEKLLPNLIRNKKMSDDRTLMKDALLPDFVTFKYGSLWMKNFNGEEIEIKKPIK